jgi:hypothetical protein
LDGLNFVLGASHSLANLSLRRNPNDVYVLVLEDIDDVFAEISATSGINPKYLGVRFHSNTAIQDWYLRERERESVRRSP